MSFADSPVVRLHCLDGLGPEECRRRLEDEGVTFTEDGRAARMHYVGWSDLMTRDAGEALD